MRASLLASLFFLFSLLNAQSWCPPGAQWTHSYADVMMDWYGVTRVEYQGDTIVGGLLAQKLRETNVIAPWGSTDYSSNTYPPMFTRYADGIVYSWDPWPGEYDTLMWFTASPGESWAAPGMNDDPYLRLTVLDTSSVAIDGVSLRQLIIQRGTWDWMPPDTLRERMGFSFNYLNGWSWFITDQPWNGLRCYHDAQIDFVATGISDCGFTLSANERVTASPIGPLPNPGTDHFTLSLPPGQHGITLFDATGRTVLHQRISGDRVTIGTEELPSGLYIVRIDEDAQPLRWVKE